MNKEFSNIIIEYREDNKISQRELAKRLDVHNSYISRIEKGIVKKVSLIFIYKLSLEIKIDFFDLVVIHLKDIYKSI